MTIKMLIVQFMRIYGNSFGRQKAKQYKINNCSLIVFSSFISTSKLRDARVGSLQGNEAQAKSKIASYAL
jgi:hypothetical protein